MPKKRKKQTPPRNVERVTVYLTPEQHEKVRTLADKDGRSMANYIRQMIDKLDAKGA